MTPVFHPPVPSSGIPDGQEKGSPRERLPSGCSNSRKCPWGDSEKQANSLEINCFTQ